MQSGMQQEENVIRLFADAVSKRATEPVVPQNEEQEAYVDSMYENPVTFGVGPAGTGKTFLASSTAADMLIDGSIRKLYVTRPMIDDEDIGYLPGDENDKFRPYFAPVYEALEERLGKGFLDEMIKHGRVEIAPLAYMRGRTFKNAFVILDEAQNTTRKQMKMFLTRLGTDVTVAINGDVSQKDIKGPDGLSHALELFSGKEDFGSVEFDVSKVERSAIAQTIVSTYEQDEAPQS